MAIMRKQPSLMAIAVKSGPVQPFPGKQVTTKELVSKLKRLITEAKNKAHDTCIQGDLQKMADLRKAAADASRKLRDVVDGKIDEFEVDTELQDAITDLERILSD